jgi:hypothetical protein
MANPPITRLSRTTQPSPPSPTSPQHQLGDADAPSERNEPDDEADAPPGETSAAGGGATPRPRRRKTGGSPPLAAPSRSGAPAERSRWTTSASGASGGHFPAPGRMAQYADHPIVVKPGELIRMYVVNAGPNRISPFHLGWRHLRAGLRGRIAQAPPRGGADRQRACGRRDDLRDPAPRAGRLSVRNPRLCRRDQGGGRHSSGGGAVTR